MDNSGIIRRYLAQRFANVASGITREVAGRLQVRPDLGRRSPNSAASLPESFSKAAINLKCPLQLRRCRSRCEIDVRFGYRHPYSVQTIPCCGRKTVLTASAILQNGRRTPVNTVRDIHSDQTARGERDRQKDAEAGPRYILSLSRSRNLRVRDCRHANLKGNWNAVMNSSVPHLNDLLSDDLLPVRSAVSCRGFISSDLMLVRPPHTKHRGANPDVT